MSDAESATTANEALSVMKQVSPVRPHGAQCNGCSGVVDATASLQQRQPSEVPTQPLSPDWQGKVGMMRASLGDNIGTHWDQNRTRYITGKHILINLCKEHKLNVCFEK